MTATHQLQLLFPPPLQVDPLSKGDGNEVARWLAIPSGTNPRVLVGVRDRHGAAQAIRRQMSGRRSRTAAARMAFAALARTGLLAGAPRNSWTVSGPADSDHFARAISDVLRVDEVCLTLAIGPRRANRKPVVQVTGTRGDPLAYVKIGDNDLTRSLVDREAAVLPQLARALPGIVTPPLIASFGWRGCRVLVQGVLDIPTRRLPEAQHLTRLSALVARVAAIDGLTVVSWQAHPVRTRLRAQLPDVHSRDARAAQLIDQIVRQVPPGLELSTGSWHGDLNDGNLALTADRTLVWDWERFEGGVPVGFDLLHHGLHRDITTRQAAPVDAAARLCRDGPRLLRALGVEADAAPWVPRLYLATLAARYVGDNQAGAGAALGRVSEWLQPALES